MAAAISSFLLLLALSWSSNATNDGVGTVKEKDMIVSKDDPKTMMMMMIYIKLYLKVFIR